MRSKMFLILSICAIFKDVEGAKKQERSRSASLLKKSLLLGSAYSLSLQGNLPEFGEAKVQEPLVKIYRTPQEIIAAELYLKNHLPKKNVLQIMNSIQCADVANLRDLKLVAGYGFGDEFDYEKYVTDADAQFPEEKLNVLKKMWRNTKKCAFETPKAVLKGIMALVKGETLSKEDNLNMIKADLEAIPDITEQQSKTVVKDLEGVNVGEHRIHRDLINNALGYKPASEFEYFQIKEAEQILIDVFHIPQSNAIMEVAFRTREIQDIDLDKVRYMLTSHSAAKLMPLAEELNFLSTIAYIMLTAAPTSREDRLIAAIPLAMLQFDEALRSKYQKLSVDEIQKIVEKKQIKY